MPQVQASISPKLLSLNLFSETDYQNHSIVKDLTYDKFNFNLVSATE